MTNMSNQCILVTGGSGALGSAIAIRFAQAGAKVAVHFHNSKITADKVASECRQFGEAYSFGADLTSELEVEKMIELISQKLGPISICIHCAGIHEDQLMMLTNYQTWKKTLSITLDSAFLVTRAVLEPMLANKWGRIIFIGSVSAHLGVEGQTAYSTAKAGLVGLTKSLSREVARKGITVNLISAGPLTEGMTKDLTPLQIEGYKKMSAVRRLGEVNEIAAFAEFIACEEASYLTGQVLHMNGGMT